MMPGPGRWLSTGEQGFSVEVASAAERRVRAILEKGRISRRCKKPDRLPGFANKHATRR